MTNIFEKLEKRTKKVRLVINECKTKYLRVSNNTRKGNQQNISVAGYSFENVKNFIYLGAYLNSRNNLHEEITHRIMSANRAYYSLNRLFTSRLISRTCKFALYEQ